MTLAFAEFVFDLIGLAAIGVIRWICGIYFDTVSLIVSVGAVGVDFPAAFTFIGFAFKMEAVRSAAVRVRQLLEMRLGLRAVQAFVYTLAILSIAIDAYQSWAWYSFAQSLIDPPTVEPLLNETSQICTRLNTTINSFVVKVV